MNHRTCPGVNPTISFWFLSAQMIADVIAARIITTAAAARSIFFISLPLDMKWPAPNYHSTKVCSAYFGFVSGEAPYEKKALVLRHSSFPLRHSSHARTGTLAVRSSLPQLTHAPLIARRIAFQMQ